MGNVCGCSSLREESGKDGHLSTASTLDRRRGAPADPSCGSLLPSSIDLFYEFQVERGRAVLPYMWHSSSLAFDQVAFQHSPAAPSVASTRIPIAWRAAALPPAEVLHLSLPPTNVVRAVPGKRGGKSMSRRSGQAGHVEQSGKWWVVRYWMDVPGQQERSHIRARICPVSGPGSLSASARGRRAREIVAESGADTEEHFSRVVRKEKSCHI